MNRTTLSVAALALALVGVACAKDPESPSRST